MDTERMIHLGKCAILGCDPGDLTDEERAFYERTVVETASMKERGITPDLPYEI